MQARWQSGLWLGKTHGSDEHIVAALDGTGVRSARSIQPEDGPLMREHMGAVTEFPGRASGRARARPGEGEPQDPIEPGHHRREARKWQITKDVWLEYGSTPRCPKCRDWEQNRRSDTRHSEQCRARLERVLRNHPVFGPRIRDSAARTNPRIAPPLQQYAHREAPREVAELAAPVEPALLDANDLNNGADELMVVHDPNESEQCEHGFWPDHDKDEREASCMAGVTAQMISDAKAAELAQLRGRSTYEVKRRRDLPDDLKIVGTRWVLVNKGSSEEPRVKARLVCQEFATYPDPDLFSGTPGLAAVKFILADVATNRGSRCLMTLDVTGAFLYGNMKRTVGIRLPPEAGCGQDVVGLLRKSLYGLRDAPQIWAQHIGGVLREAGFSEAPTAAGIFRHASRRMLLAAHVDDVLVSGDPADLEWLEKTLRRHYELKCTIVGPNPDQAKSTKFLKRTITWRDNGVAWEADERHAKELILEWASPTNRAVCAPLTSAANVASSGGQLDPAMAKKFRSGAAKIQYVSHDRADLGVVATVLASKMSAPSVSDLDLLRRAADYLRTRPTLVLFFAFSTGAVGPLRVWTDSDWASCEVTRRSRSGGVVIWHDLTRLHFCRLQDSIALSSAEAELKSTCKGLAEALALRELIEFLLQAPCDLEHMTDSSACVGILKRKGAGPVKHLSVRQLWTQEIFNRPGTSTHKVPRSMNPADCLCSIPNAESLRVQLGRMNFEVAVCPPRGRGDDRTSVCV